MAYELSSDIGDNIKAFRLYSTTYGPWSIELNIIRYIYKKYMKLTTLMDETVSENDILYLRELLTTILSQNHVYTSLLDPSIKAVFETKWTTQLQEFVGKSWKDLFDYYFQFWKTWDHFSCGILLFYIIHDLQLISDVEYQPYIKILYKVCFTTPDKRLSIQKTIGKLRQLL
jgi:hypothetical protein